MSAHRLTAAHKEAIKRCQASVAWFLRTFGKIKHPSAGILTFHPFSYQRHAIKCFRKYRLNIFRKCRQSGVSKIAGAFALWFGMFHSHKTILIVSRTDDDAMNFLRDHILFLFEHLPQWMQELWKPVKKNDHEIIFPNGSKIKSLTSHPDVLRSNASSLNIIDEAAFIQGMDVMWAGGWPCTRFDTLIQTSDGLVKVGELANGGNPWKDHDIQVATDDGYQTSDKAYVSGLKPTIVIDSALGFQIEGTGHHRLRTLDAAGDYVWRQLNEFAPGDVLVSIPDQFVGKRRYLDNGVELTPDFGEILGLYVGDGSLSRSRPKRFKIVFDPQDQETRDKIVAKFNNLGLGLDTQAYAESEFDTENLRLNSAPFCELMIRNGLASKTRPQNAEIPPLILGSDREVLCAFLRGLFDAGGWCYPSTTCLKLGMASTSEKLTEQVQVCLHSLGIIAKRYMVDPKQHPDRNNQESGRYSDEPYWRIDIWDAASKLKFREKIGFITTRKQKALEAFKGSMEHTELNHPALVAEFAAGALRKLLAGGTFRQCTDSRKWNLYRIRRTGVVRLELVRELATELDLKDRLSSYVQRGFYFDSVAMIRHGATETFDISVPHNNTYLANGVVSHNTLQHGGNVIVISTCVVPQTYVFTSDGMAQIGDFDCGQDGFSDYNGPDILTKDGLTEPSKFYRRAAEATKKLTTKLGYDLEGTYKHRLWICRDREQAGWAFMDEVKPGDYVPIVRGRNVFGHDDLLGFVDGPDRYHTSSLKIDRIDEELAYLLGVILAEGNIADTYVTVTTGDEEIRNKFFKNSLGVKWVPEERATHIRCCSTRFVRFLKWFGFVQATAPYKTLPRRLWSCSRDIISAFLRGLYDGDGHSRTRDGEVGYTSTSKELIKQLRVLLCNYGIICREEYHKPYKKRFQLNGRDYVSECRESWRLVVRSGEADKFYEAIGFGLDRKHTNQINTRASREFVPNVRYWLGELRKGTGLSIGELKRRGINAPSLLFKARKRDLTERAVAEDLVQKLNDFSNHDAYKVLKSLVDPAIYWDEVKTVEDGWSETVDFSIPDDPTFWSNGLMSHNTNGVGNWYWATATDAEAGVNQFNPIIINWWDMDWVIEYTDPLSKEHKRIAPRDAIRNCDGTTYKDPKYGDIRLDPIKYGPYWSPWLEEQYRALQERGEAWKFEQEVLANFVGSGNTVLPKEVLAFLQTTIKDPIYKVKGLQTYVHPVTGNVEEIDFDFNDPNEGLWVWAKPVAAKPMKKKGNQIVDPGEAAHSYVMGVDIATGKGRDYSAIEVFDVDTREQVAEFMAHCLPRELVKYIDRIGRWYNCALAVVERNNGGDTLIDSLRHDVMYPRLWRKKDINDKPRPPGLKGARMKARPLKVAPYGFSTTTATKPTLNKFLLDYIRDNIEEGYAVFSKRLLKQFQTYVRKRDRSGRDTMKTEAEDGAGNFDDLVMACGLALIGTADAFMVDAGNLLPMGGGGDFKSQKDPTILSDDARTELQEEYATKGGPGLLMPMTLAPSDPPEIAAQRQLDAYTLQLGGIPISQGRPLVTPPKFFYERK